MMLLSTWAEHHEFSFPHYMKYSVIVSRGERSYFFNSNFEILYEKKFKF
jgi:hypothetical protein